MTIETRPLSELDDAKRLQDLVYTAYGLTYHRSFMYEPERLFELNQRGQIRSVLAKNASGEVLAHMATIRPWFESIPKSIAEQAPTAVEIGLSIVHPEHRGRRLQTAVGLACLMNERDSNPHLKNMFAKCLTVHTHSQRSARGMLGRASALLLGSVPSWVAHESGERPTPMTTVVMQSPCATDKRQMFVPDTRAALITDLVDSSILGRTVVGVKPSEASLHGATHCSHWFEPARRRGIVHVWSAGEHTVERVLSSTKWLVNGHMEHITVLLPIDEPGVAAIVPELEEAGLFFGGFLPDIEGRDCLVMEYLSWDQLDLSGMNLLGEETERLRDAVVSEWQRARGSTNPIEG